eukprot:COSAG06_NODE_3289_length_5550_cov_26.579894_4_plen_49_part_00
MALCVTTNEVGDAARISFCALTAQCRLTLSSSPAAAIAASAAASTCAR